MHKEDAWLWTEPYLVVSQPSSLETTVSRFSPSNPLLFSHGSTDASCRLEKMVCIRQATLEDLLEMQNANLFCLPENYQTK